MGKTVIDLKELSEHLLDLFGTPPAEELLPLPCGYKCENFRLRCGPDVFFLKQYNYRISHWIAEIKYAERFFAKHDLPIIEPISDRFGRPMFLFGEHWYSLFPYVDGKPPVRGHIADATVVSLGAWLARLHRAGGKMDKDTFQTLHGWDRDAFQMEFIELEHQMEKRRKDQPHLNDVLQTLRYKAMIVERNHITPRHIPLAYDCLLHGDFIYQNVFVDDQGEITHIFDLEKTSRGPRAYELARSVLINCFDTSWDEGSYKQGKLMLDAYREIYPISFEEFYHGMRMYMIGVAHSTWVEARLVLGTGEEQHGDLFDSHALRIQHVTDDPQEFCERLYS